MKLASSIAYPLRSRPAAQYHVPVLQLLVAVHEGCNWGLLGLVMFHNPGNEGHMVGWW